MTITITLTATPGQSGVDFNSYYDSYFAGLVPQGWPYILGGNSTFDGDQIVLLGDVSDGPQTQAIILDGSDFNYYFNGHTLSGTLTTVRLSTLGGSYNQDGSFDMQGGHIAGVTTPVQISGLHISNLEGTAGDVHDVISGLMGVGLEGGLSNPAPLTGFLWAEAHNVVGSTGNDAYDGTTFGDTVRGNGGNDVFDGKGGTDIAVYSGARSNYTITLNPGGSITVRDNRGGSPDGTDTLTNFERAKFSDLTLDLGSIGGSGDQPPQSLALSKTSVAENKAAGTVVGRLSAVDPEGKALTYALLNDAGGKFKLSGNNLVTTKAFDYEYATKPQVTVEVTDASGLKAQKSFTITITDVVETQNGKSTADTLKGGKGADKLVGKGGADKLLGAAGNDELNGGEGNDQLDGGAGADTLRGGNGADKLIGGLGADKLLGGAGADNFVFKTIKDSASSKAGRDTIIDFSSKSDKINLYLIDAKSGTKKNDAFDFIGKAKAFTGDKGELRYDKVGADTFVYGDVNGDRKADFAIKLDGNVVLKDGSFLL